MISALLLMAAPADFPAARPVTIGQVHANPASWDGQWVRVAGWVHSCGQLDCALSEGPENSGLQLSFERIATFDAWLQPQLPAHIEVTARVDSSCLVHACTDRPATLRRMHAESLQTATTSPSKD